MRQIILKRLLIFLLFVVPPGLCLIFLTTPHTATQHLLRLTIYTFLIIGGTTIGHLAFPYPTRPEGELAKSSETIAR